MNPIFLTFCDLIIETILLASVLYNYNMERTKKKKKRKREKSDSSLITSDRNGQIDRE